MSHINYTQLSQNERIIIQNRLENGESFRQIAIAINRSVSTISREVNRNGHKNNKIRVNVPHELFLDSRHYRGTTKVDRIRKRKKDYNYRLKHYQKYFYEASNARECAKSRIKTQPLLLNRIENSFIRKYVLEKLDLRWSPEQISGRLLLEQSITISPKTIYKYIYRDEKQQLARMLRRKGKPKRSSKVHIFNKTNRDKHSINERPDAINNLERIGDLEGDTIFGKDTKDRLLTHVDRKTGVLSISLIKGYNANNIAINAQKDVRRIFGDINSITYDNGAEFSLWRDIERKTNSTIYFANPYHSWERGRNENANGLIRDFLPKGTDFKKLTIRDILEIESLINNRPRKRFKWLTPLEYREKCCT